jgi:putative acyl-CoA dehydrogenase
MRSGVVAATHHAAHRRAFGKELIDQPLMRNVLADLSLESEAATALAMRLARAYDEAHADAQAGEDTSDAQLFKRLATAVGKYWVCKRAPNHAFEALECLGGNGYVEESGMPRLYREAPLASIWEGSGNVMSLDVLRALTRAPRALEVFLDEVEQARGGDRRLDARVKELKDRFADAPTLETRARRVVEDMALCLQGSLLVRHAPPAVADAFCASRLGSEGGLEYGTLPADSDFEGIIARGRAHPA